MKAIIGFSRDNSFKSKLIRWVTRSPVSHAFICYDSPIWGPNVIVHATARGIVVEPYERAMKGQTVKLFELEHDMSSGFAAVREYLTAGYDFRSVIWNGILYVLFWLTGARFLWKLIARNAARVSCSEFGVLWLQGAEFPESKELDAELTHPGMLLEFATESEHSRDMSKLRENGP